MKLYTSSLHTLRSSVIVGSRCKGHTGGFASPFIRKRGMATDSDFQTKLNELQKYSACDVGSAQSRFKSLIDVGFQVSDALLKLQKGVPGQPARAGYLADIIPFAASSALLARAQSGEKLVAPVSTLKYVEKSSQVDPLPANSPNAIPKGSHWVDETDAGTVLVIEQPEGSVSAAIGGIMALRMKVRGVLGCVVGGRVRDIEELQIVELPIFAFGKSTIGSGGDLKVYGRDLSVTVRGVQIDSGDIVFCDPIEGIVVVPKNLLDDTLSLMAKLVPADDNVKEAVAKGMSVAEAFKNFRG